MLEAEIAMMCLKTEEGGHTPGYTDGLQKLKGQENGFFLQSPGKGPTLPTS